VDDFRGHDDGGRGWWTGLGGGMKIASRGLSTAAAARSIIMVITPAKSRPAHCASACSDGQKIHAASLTPRGCPSLDWGAFFLPQLRRASRAAGTSLESGVNGFKPIDESDVWSNTWYCFSPV
jgi:hypothetical protein